MPETTADPPAPSCSLPLSETGVQQSQTLDPDPFWPRARDARGRFGKGSSGNPCGRPRGIRNPKRRVPDLAARPLSAEALSNLLDRKPHLLRSLAIQLLPPSRAAVDPAERLGIDLSAWRTADDCGQVMATVLAAIARGEIAPAEGARIAAGACPVALGPQAGSSGFSRRKRAKTASELLREGLCCRPGVVARDAALRRIEASVGGKHG